MRISIFTKSMQADTLREELEPQVTSADPNERKLARRLRIERRWDALKKSRQNIEESDKPSQTDEETDDIQNQLRKSTELLEKYLLEGEEYITNVRVANESREVDRREHEGINREKVLEQLDEEANTAIELYNKISNKWTQIQKQNDPLHINEEIMDQKEKCDMLISQKDAMIAMLNDELKKAERQFSKDQRKQMEDINTLAQRIEKQVSFMRRAYRQELNLLEDVVLKERQYLTDCTDNKWEELFNKRQNQEITNSNKKFEQVEEFNERMEKLRLDFQEHCRETKINLENDIEELQRELEKIKALALLNSEKLDYNYQILKKREDENIIIKSQQKRRMNKLQDVINDLRRNIFDYESTTSNNIKKLTDNIRKLHKSILDVEAKADHFAHVNDERFHMLWEMNKKRVQGVLKKILDTDKVLYEQQMGLDWEPPNNYIVDKKTLPSYKLALNSVPPEFIHEVFRAGPSKSRSRKSLVSQALTNDVVIDSDNVNYKKVVKHILTRISDKTGFLAQKRLKELLRGYEDDQKHLVRLDNVFAALRIQGRAYIDILFQHFEPYTFCPTCQGTTDVQASRNESKVNSAGSQISSIFSRFGDPGDNFRIAELDDVIDAIRQPDNILDEIISELVTSEDFYDNDSLSDQDDHERIEDICGVAALENLPDTKNKDKFKPSSLRKKLSSSRVPLDAFACQYRHPLRISHVYVLKALREFVSSYYTGKAGVPTVGARLDRKRLTISRYLTENDIRNYWEKFKLNFSEDRVRVWDALLSGLKKYHEILKDRRTICDEVLQLRKENAELKRLLSNYLDHSEFLPPSCAKERPPYIK